VIFALARLPDGGCILADEVGLGKTIEAGLVIAQVRAEGARRVLVVTPKALLGQWKQELFSLFNIDAQEVTRAQGGDGFAGEGVLLATRDLVGARPARRCCRRVSASTSAWWTRRTKSSPGSTSASIVATGGRARTCLTPGLRAGDDDSYQRWRRHAQERRYAPPLVERLLDAEFEIT
jgi:hypothetical protein